MTFRNRTVADLCVNISIIESFNVEMSQLCCMQIKQVLIFIRARLKLCGSCKHQPKSRLWCTVKDIIMFLFISADALIIVR